MTTRNNLINSFETGDNSALKVQSNRTLISCDEVIMSWVVEKYGAKSFYIIPPSSLSLYSLVKKEWSVIETLRESRLIT